MMKQACAVVVMGGLMAACSPAGKDGGQTAAQANGPSAPVAQGAVSAAPTAGAPVPESGRVSQYSTLKACKTLKENVDEAWAELICPGEGGYKLRILAGDLREDVVVIPPGGKPEQSLDIPGVTRRGGFNHMGEIVEWRGTKDNGAFTPLSLIMRFNVQENPNVQKDTSFLLAVRLDGAKPCITALVEPGPRQNDKARQAADTPAACLTSYYDEHLPKGQSRAG